MLALAKLFRTKNISGFHRPAKHIAAFHCGNRCSSQDASAGVPYKTLQVLLLITTLHTHNYMFQGRIKHELFLYLTLITTCSR